MKHDFLYDRRSKSGECIATNYELIKFKIFCLSVIQTVLLNHKMTKSVDDTKVWELQEKKNILKSIIFSGIRTKSPNFPKK